MVNKLYFKTFFPDYNIDSSINFNSRINEEKNILHEEELFKKDSVKCISIITRATLFINSFEEIIKYYHHEEFKKLNLFMLYLLSEINYVNNFIERNQFTLSLQIKLLSLLIYFTNRELQYKI